MHSGPLLLSLPIELRTAIYEQLIPNDIVYDYCFISKWGGPRDHRPLCHDKQPYCPAILRINRQDLDEVIGMFYVTAQSKMFVTGSECYFFGVKFCTQDLDNPTANKLPPGLRFVHLLHISISMGWLWNPGE
ncbi:hypothetical protein L207DRAFT_575444 [Hyaloscypha variabilis F]|jgi:hypothetical protein|uniref:Uncharacterized protein n=1 Tax=Hyaloscypha variabilis (strain UAMH 11265 / GT02V1 / F) TaxID=1149755 RepID=A0A2J6SDH8_HYAVF|nr:hypothetical protein L207DRAFT_575444 [Hyaloscypha variabilis F]